MDRKFKIVNSFTTSAIVVIVFITIVTVLSDLQPLLKDWLKDVFWHHWIGKGILASVIFVGLALFLSLASFNNDENKLHKGLWLLFGIAILGALTIYSFYIYEAFLSH